MNEKMVGATLTYRQGEEGAVKEIIESHYLTRFEASESEGSTTTLVFDCSEGSVGKTISALVDQLVFRSIPFSFYWETADPDDSGEKHLRCADGQSRVWEFRTADKRTVDIESVREAATTGENALWNLIDEIEDTYIPWEWGQVQAA